MSFFIIHLLLSILTSNPPIFEERDVYDRFLINLATENPEAGRKFLKSIFENKIKIKRNVAHDVLMIICDEKAKTDKELYAFLQENNKKMAEINSLVADILVLQNDITQISKKLEFLNLKFVGDLIYDNIYSYRRNENEYLKALQEFELLQEKIILKTKKLENLESECHNEFDKKMLEVLGI